jgi:hypothetical protein
VAEAVCRIDAIAGVGAGYSKPGQVICVGKGIVAPPVGDQPERMPEMELKELIASGEPAYDEITAGAVPLPGQLKSESCRRKLAVEDGSTCHHDIDWAAGIRHSHIIDDNLG